MIHERLRSSLKNRRFSKTSVSKIRSWQNNEIECLRRECHKRNKDFYVVKNMTPAGLQHFIDNIESGFSSFNFANTIVDRITDNFPSPCELHIADGDKTIIKQDSFSVCTDNYITHVFDGDFYTGYQSLQFTEEIANLQYNMEKLSSVQLNEMIYNKVADKNYIILSSGITEIWERLSVQLGLKNVIADTLISADTKYYVVKLLKDRGYTIITYGDSKNDYYMLKQADKGYLYIGSYLSRSLRCSDTSGISLIYDKSPFIMTDVNDRTNDDVQICKSDSGVNGALLADAHIRLGKKLGEIMRETIPNMDSAVIVLERGGRFFGNGIYTGFGGTFYSYYPKKDILPDLRQSIAVIVDSVINTGKSVLETIDRLRQKNPDIEIIIVSNVIQDNAVKLLQEYKIFAIRTSSNSFVGSRQSIQKNGKGPDTADRLFNYIN